jgi:hypothetical protein
VPPESFSKENIMKEKNEMNCSFQDLWATKFPWVEFVLWKFAHVSCSYVPVLGKYWFCYFRITRSSYNNFFNKDLILCKKNNN